MRVWRQFYFLNERFYILEKHNNTYKRTKTKKTVLNALKNTHLRGRKSLVRLYAFLCFLCAFLYFFVLFLYVDQRRQHFSAHKKHLRRRKSLVWRFVLFLLFMFFMRIKNLWVKVACLCFVLFVLLVCVKSFWLKKKTVLIPSFILLLISSYY